VVIHHGYRSAPATVPHRLDGDIDQFMAAAFAQKAFGTEAKEIEDVE